jgi:hypothetical protein
MREIGSEFWLDLNLDSDKLIKKPSKTSDINKFLYIGNDRRLLFSGRTAIDFVLQDIPIHVKKVYMPSYCCESMLQPFLDRGIFIEYYDVLIGDQGLKYLIDINEETDIFFAISYFGYGMSNMDSYIDKFKKRNILVIEDITHRIFNKKNHCHNSDYLIASLRKWFPLLSGGLAIKAKGGFKDIWLQDPVEEHINKRLEAMKLKAKYMNGMDKTDDNLKNKFLSLYSEFNRSIYNNYRNFKIDKLSQGLLERIIPEYLIEKRRNNAELLHSCLDKIDGVTPLFYNKDFTRDCPLFVPIRVEKKIRPKLVDFLKLHRIYCPIHWPIFSGLNLNDLTEEIYNEELSLVCDQRYGEKDMKRLIGVLKEFFKRNG